MGSYRFWNPHNYFFIGRWICSKGGIFIDLLYLKKDWTINHSLSCKIQSFRTLILSLCCSQARTGEWWNKTWRIVVNTRPQETEVLCVIMVVCCSTARMTNLSSGGSPSWSKVFLSTHLDLENQAWTPGWSLNVVLGHNVGSLPGSCGTNARVTPVFLVFLCKRRWPWIWAHQEVP